VYLGAKRRYINTLPFLPFLFHWERSNINSHHHHSIRFAFAVDGPAVWNSLPAKLPSLDLSLDVFRKRLKTVSVDRCWKGRTACKMHSGSLPWCYSETFVRMAWRGGATDLQSAGCAFDSRSSCCCVTTVGKLSTSFCLCRQAVYFGAEKVMGVYGRALVYCL